MHPEEEVDLVALDIDGIAPDDSFVNIVARTVEFPCIVYDVRRRSDP
jgi:hypothetical protein